MARKSRKNTEGSSAVQVMPPKRVFQTAIYVRISVENERKIEADSIGTQIQMLKDFASQMPELSIYDVYCDDDITGTNFARPEFSRMMNDVRDRNVNCIMVKDLSRLGRNYLESGEYIEKVFPFFGIRFIAINDRIDTFEKPIDISVQLKNMANEMYAKDISKKIRSTMKSLQAQGKFIGSQPPYGYMRNPEDKYALLVDPETAPVVREMFQKILDGYTVHNITLQFNERGIPSPGRYKYDKGLVKNAKFRDSVWFFPTLRRMLSDPIYLGWIQNGKYESHFQKGGNKCVKVPKEDWIIIKGVHEPIIDEETFNAVQEILTVKQTEGANIGRYDSKGNQESILRGKLRCGECGKSMAIRKKKNHGIVQYWYICPMHEHYNSSYCTKKSIKKEQMKQMVFTLIKKQMQLYVDARLLIVDLNRHASSRGKYEIYQEQIKNTEKQIAHYAQMKASLYQDYSEGLLTEADYITVGQDYARKMDDLKIFMASLSRDALKYAPEYTGSEKWAKRVEEFQQQEQLSREMVEAFIDAITVYEDGRTEVAFRNMDELEAVLYQASERRKEDMRYAV